MVSAPANLPAALPTRPDLTAHLKSLVLHSVISPESKRAYGRNLGRFLHWFETEHPVTGFSNATVERYRQHLAEAGLSPSAVNLALSVCAAWPRKLPIRICCCPPWPIASAA
jgi:site-specific recombinase XerD